MDTAAWVATLQWTGLFVMQTLATLDDWILVCAGGSLAAAWLAMPHTRPTRRTMLWSVARWTLRLAALALATTAALGWLATERTADAVLSMQLRAVIARTMMDLVIGAGAMAAAVLLWSWLRPASVERALQDP